MTRSLQLALCASAGVLLFAVVAHARALPDIDVLAAAPVAAATAKAKAARDTKRFVNAHFEERLDLPTLLWLDSTATASKATRGGSPEAAARAHLKELSGLYRMTPGEIDAAPLHHVDALDNGALLVKLTNQRDGIEVFRESVAVLLNAAHQPLAIGGYLGSTRSAPAVAKAARSPFLLSAAQAVAFALGDYGFAPSIVAELEPAARPADVAHLSFTIARGRASDDGARMNAPARAKAVWFRMPQGLIAAYYVELEMVDAGTREADFYGYVIAADDGRILFRNNQTVDAAFTYKAYAETSGIRLPLVGPQGRNGTPHPTGTNNGYQAPFVPQNDLSLQNGPISTLDPWLDAGATRTIGNNVEAWANHTGPAPATPGTDPRDGVFDADPNECDLNAPQVGDFHACTSAPGTFSYVFDPAQPPAVTKTQVMAAIVNLFYVNNWLHDWYYDAGFREIDGNAQENNFGRGGLGGDSLRAQAQDYAGLNNANMSTPADGARPRMRMYIFTGAGSATVNVSGVGNLAVGSAQFGPSVFDVTGSVALVDDTVAPVTDACQPLVASVAGQVALIDRGSCSFKTKALNAQSAGAVGVLIVNSTSGVITMADDASIATAITIPLLSVSLGDGTAIKTALAAGAVTARLQRQAGNDRDGALDNSIVSHEWGHYISNRLIGNASGLTTNQARGLGEGWADFHSLLMMVKDEDALVAANANFAGTYGVSGYPLDGPQYAGITQSTAYYNGNRRYPYSSDLTRNPLSFRHIQTGTALPPSPPPAFTGDNAEVHNTGEVWGSMLWQCYSNLLRDSGRLRFAEAQERMKRYLVASYKLTPVNPTFVEARDALFAAIAASDAADLALCMSAFAQRGAGLRATFTGDRYGGTNAGVTESASIGNDLEITGISYDGKAGLYCDADAFLDNGETGKLTVTLRNVGAGTLAATTVALSGPSVVSFPTGSSLPVGPIAPFATASVTFDIALTGAPATSTATIIASAVDPSLAIAGPVSATTILPVERDRAQAVSTSDDVEDPLSSWTTSLQAGTTDAALNWRRVTLSTFDHYWNGPTGEAAGIAWLTSPPLQVAAAGPFTMSFTHRHAFEFGGSTRYDGGVIEVSQDGGTTWVDIETLIGATTVYNGAITAYTGSENPLAGRRGFVGESTGFPATLRPTIAFPAAVLGKTILVRFGAATDGGGHLSGWDLDDISFGGLANTPFPGYAADAHSCAAPLADSGTPQSAAINTVFASALRLRLLRTGTPVAGASITFSSPASGPSGTFAGGSRNASTLTDNNGYATAPAFTANSAGGTYNVVATAGIGSLNFELTNSIPASAYPGAPQSLAASPGNGQATFTFVAPASSGLTAITGYTVTCNPGSIPGANASAPVIVTGLANGTSYTCSVVAANSYGAGPASAAVTVIPAAGIAPAITSASSAAFTVDTPGIFTVTASGAPAPALLLSGALPSGVTFTPGTGILAGRPALGTVGSYPVTLSASNGILPNATQPFTLTVAKANQAITFANPGSQPLGPTPFALSASTTSALAVTFASATPSVCAVSGSLVTMLATGTCTVNADQAGSANFNAAPRVQQSFAITAATNPRLGNISTRMQVLTGNDVLIGGFVIGGATPKTVVVRARGPSLVPYGITNALANPTLQLVRSSDQTTVAFNDDWAVAINSAALTASGFAPDNSLESAILVTLDPGAYTAIVTGAGGATGVGIIEVFEVDHPEAPLINISTRGQVLTGNDVMIGGFVIQGSGPQTVVIRARGPSLIPYGITNALLNPTLQLVRSSDQATIAVNDEWGSATNAAAITASGFAPSDSRESAILITLDPGAYTAIVTGVGNSTGVGIIEVFATP